MERHEGRQEIGELRRTAAAAARPPTMMDVAARAGVSQTTVSLVLNNIRERAAVGRDPGAGPRGGARARLHARRGTRRPRPAASGATAIAFIADEISTDPWCALQLDAVRERAWEHGLTVTAGVSHGDPELEAALLDAAAAPAAGRPDLRHDPHPAHPAAARSSAQIPTVLLNCYVQDHSLASVVPGELLGGYVATLHLIRAGHRRIAHIHGQSWTDPSRDRLSGYRRALAEHDILFDPALVLPGNWEPPTGYQHTMTLMDAARSADRDLRRNDMMAVGCYDALKERGLRIPEDVSVVGYDDREIAQFMRPPLTTVVLPHFDMGLQARRALIDGQLRPGGPAAAGQGRCPLVERASVAPPSPSRKVRTQRAAVSDRRRCRRRSRRAGGC